MKGVIMLVNEFPPLPVGGAEIQAERLSAYLAGQGWPVWVVTRRGDGLSASEKRNGFTILRPQTLGSGKFRTITFMFFTVVMLFRMRREYQILHAHLAFGPAFVATMLGRLLGKCVIVKLGGSGSIGDVHTSRRTWRGRLRLAAIRRWADIVIVLTNVMRNEALNVGIPPEHIRIFNNGIDAPTYTFDTSKENAKKQLGLAGKILLLFVGRLDPVKSLSTILDALAISLDLIPALHLIIVGDGPERIRLETQAKTLGIGNAVEFAGNQKDVRRYLQAADIFVLPSITEGISNALLEAMAAGVACLATPVGGNLEVLAQGKYGVLIPVGDINAWAKAFTEIGNDSTLRAKLGQLARERIFDYYDFNVVGAQYEALYTELLGNISGSYTNKVKHGNA
jgi:glycosyltransferase involved in cell wall biosynthesis